MGAVVDGAGELLSLPALSQSVLDKGIMENIMSKTGRVAIVAIGVCLLSGCFEGFTDKDQLAESEVVVDLSSMTADAKAPYGHVEEEFVQLPNVTFTTSTLLRFNTLEHPIYFTSIQWNFDSAVVNTVDVLLYRDGEVYDLLDVTTDLAATMSWNVERMHGKLFIRKGDRILFRNSVGDRCTLTFSARSS